MLALGLKMKENNSRVDKAQGLKKESKKANYGLKKEIKQLGAESSRLKKGKRKSKLQAQRGKKVVRG